MAPRATAMAALNELGIDEFCARIIAGDSYTAIAQSIGVGIASVCDWLSADAERSARVCEADRLSARTAEDKAEAVLLDKTMAVDRARELASHYRWRAKVRDRRQYGDQVQVDGNVNVMNLSEEELGKRIAAISAQLAAAETVALPPAQPGDGEVKP